MIPSISCEILGNLSFHWNLFCCQKSFWTGSLWYRLSANETLLLFLLPLSLSAAVGCTCLALTANALFWVCRWALITLPSTKTSQAEEKELTSHFLKAEGSGLRSKGPFLNHHHHRAETGPAGNHEGGTCANSGATGGIQMHTPVGRSEKTGYMTILKQPQQ